MFHDRRVIFDRYSILECAAIEHECGAAPVSQCFALRRFIIRRAQAFKHRRILGVAEGGARVVNKIRSRTIKNFVLHLYSPFP